MHRAVAAPLLLMGCSLHTAGVHAHRLQEAAPPPDIGAATTALNARVPVLQAKVADCDRELVGIKTQLARLRPAQQGPLKQKALGILKRRKMYEQQLGATQSKAFNLEQSAFALENIKDAREHMSVSGTAARICTYMHGYVETRWRGVPCAQLKNKVE